MRRRQNLSGLASQNQKAGRRFVRMHFRLLRGHSQPPTYQQYIAGILFVQGLCIQHSASRHYIKGYSQFEE